MRGSATVSRRVGERQRSGPTRAQDDEVEPMTSASIADLRAVASWLEEYSGHYGGEREVEESCLRVAEWLRYVVDTRTEGAARDCEDRPAAPAPIPLQLAQLQRQMTKQTEERRVARLKNAFEAVWRARSA